MRKEDCTINCLIFIKVIHIYLSLEISWSWNACILNIDTVDIYHRKFNFLLTFNFIFLNYHRIARCMKVSHVLPDKSCFFFCFTRSCFVLKHKMAHNIYIQFGLKILFLCYTTKLATLSHWQYIKPSTLQSICL